MAIIKSVLMGSLAALASAGFASAAGCSGPVINSISYCQPVEQIVYSNLGFSGTYQDVTGMDFNSCTCSYAPKSFSGPLAPLDEGLSLHFRGPLHLKRFAVYNPGAVSKREEPVAHAKRHHAHHAYNKRDLVVTTITQTVVVDQFGNTLSPKPTVNANGIVEEKKKEKFSLITKAADPKPTAGAGGNSGNGNGSGNGGNGSGKGGNKEDEVDTPIPTKPKSGKWGRRAYYNAAQQAANGLVFMNHAGGQGSGNFDQNCGGLSISYMTSDAKKGSATPQILHNAAIKTRDEFIIFSDEKCDASCGFSRPGIPAYKGFAGKQKVFLFEFTMPEDKTSDSFNDDLPAIWALNSKIPRTAQYGLKDKPCSCWDSGCGELDLFEVLTDANPYVKTHYHSKQGAVGKYGGGGDPNYFARPYNAPVAAAVVFDESNGSVFISILPANTEFPESFDDAYLEVLKGKGKVKSASIFKVPS